jgi:hypothetical protein
MTMKKKKSSKQRRIPKKKNALVLTEASLAARFGNDLREPVVKLLASIKLYLPALEELLSDVNSDYEDLVYRFYHQSFKVYRAQGNVERIVKALRNLLPRVPLNAWFTKIAQEGTGHEFKMEDNKRWLEVTRPQIEAFFHARFFLEMVVRYGRELKVAPNLLPDGWAAVLYLYNLR